MSIATVTYRPPALDDVPAAAHCHLECWREAYSELLTPARLAELLTIDRFLELWRQLITGGRVVRLAVQGPEVIGFATAGPAEEVGVQVSFTLNAINVRRAYWGTGVGQRLLDMTLGGREAFLWVFRDNARARAFYLRNGFRPDGAERVEPVFGPIEIRMVRSAASAETADGCTSATDPAVE
jgi:GNAT superfamily N-acetyltransferase